MKDGRESSILNDNLLEYIRKLKINDKFELLNMVLKSIV
jgi:hypothetical protein